MLRLFLNKFTNEYKSIISDLFYGILETKSQCQRCQNFIYNFQISIYIQFPLKEVWKKK